jgi:hypothetical protein
MNATHQQNFRYLAVICLCSALSLVSVSVQAENSIRTFGGVEFGYSTYSFDQKIDQTLVFPTTSLTAGMAYGSYNLLASYTFSLDSAEVSEEDFTGSADRQDLDLVLVYQASKQFSFFGGYKLGETSLESISRDDDNGPIRKESFEQAGPFVGISYNWIIEDAGRLSMSIAYAYLDATNQFVSDGDGPDPGEPPEFDDITGTTTGKTTGYSYNLSWTMPLKGNWLYRARLRFNQYKQDINYQGMQFNDINEDSTSLLMGLVYII